MATYVVLLKFTEEARKTIGDLRGLDRAKQGVQAMGVQWKGWYLTLGQYDAVVLVEAPDDETVAKLALAQARVGGVVSETLRAFTEDEFRQMAAALPPAPAAP
jgi:uncharacterized protein with GYD domain